MSCRECYTGHAKAGTSQGTELELHGLQVYVANPASEQASHPDTHIVVISDIFGWKTNNMRLLADAYAQSTGCRVLVPDFLIGSAAPQWIMKHVDRILGEGGVWGWIAKPYLVAQVMWTMLPFQYRNKPHAAYPRVKQWMEQFRGAESADAKIGVVGFCWGGYHATRLAHGELAASGKPIIDVAFTAHPSELQIPGDIEDICLPYSMVIGDVDFAMPIAAVEQAREILLKKALDFDSEVVVITNAKHGFAVRADSADQDAMAMADRAFDQAVNWFGKHLLGSQSRVPDK